MKGLVMLFALAAFAAALPVNELPPYGDVTLRLIEFGPGVRHWMSEKELLALITENKAKGQLGVGFVDVTDHPVQAVNTLRSMRAFPTRPSQQSIVDPLAARMNAASLTSFLTTFSGFNNRYYTSSTGVASAEWLRSTMQAVATRAGRNDTTCTLFQHTWAQPSVICTITGTTRPSEVVVCSAHSDSINSLSPVNGAAPGADDDGSGVADFYEVFRVIVESGFRPSRSIHFIGYAAEEVGLRGSQAVVADYVRRGVDVYGVYHNEMSGYPGSKRSLTVLEDYVDTTLTNFVKLLVPEYTSLPLQTARCGYGCSDHASWTAAGYSAICTAEAGPSGEVNPNMHRASDTVAQLDMGFSLEFAKLALGTVIELTQFSG